MVPTIILVGPSGGGRTAVAAALGAQLGLPFVEVENVLEEQAGDSYARLNLSLDPAQMREHVGKAAVEALGREGIVTVVPSALDDPQVAARLLELREGGVPIAAVSAKLEVLVRRAGLNAPRSAALGQPRKWFRDFVVENRKRYMSVGAVEFDTGTSTADEVARLVASEFALQ